MEPVQQFYYSTELAQITIIRVVGMVAGRAKIADTMLVMSEERRVTAIVPVGARLMGERMVMPSIRMDPHALANLKGLRTGGDVVMALGAVEAARGVQTPNVAT